MTPKLQSKLLESDLLHNARPVRTWIVERGLIDSAKVVVELANSLVGIIHPLLHKRISRISNDHQRFLVLPRRVVDEELVLVEAGNNTS